MLKGKKFDAFTLESHNTYLTKKPCKLYDIHRMSQVLIRALLM